MRSFCSRILPTHYVGDTVPGSGIVLHSSKSALVTQGPRNSVSDRKGRKDTWTGVRYMLLDLPLSCVFCLPLGSFGPELCLLLPRRECSSPPVLAWLTPVPYRLHLLSTPCVPGTVLRSSQLPITPIYTGGSEQRQSREQPRSPVQKCRAWI